jgi:hypothetical protein
MRSFSLISIVGFFLLTAGIAEEVKIREFDIKTIESLGKELYQRDLLAAQGTDLLFDKHPEAAKIIRGWITDIGKDTSYVYFLQKQEEQLSLAYAISFQKDRKPLVVDQLGKPVPARLMVRYKARQTAIEALPRLFDRTYNFEVLDDPKGDGFLVYALASTKDADEIMVGGHFRISVSKDGTTVTAVDALSRSLLILNKRPKDLPKDSETAAYTMSHIVSPTPVETHVFLSLQNNKPFYIATGEEEVWKVENGKITKAKPDE